jgi:hypothetical protein
MLTALQHENVCEVKFKKVWSATSAQIIRQLRLCIMFSLQVTEKAAQGGDAAGVKLVDIAQQVSFSCSAPLDNRYFHLPLHIMQPHFAPILPRDCFMRSDHSCDCYWEGGTVTVHHHCSQRNALMLLFISCVMPWLSLPRRIRFAMRPSSSSYQTGNQKRSLLKAIEQVLEESALIRRTMNLLS